MKKNIIFIIIIGILLGGFLVYSTIKVDKETTKQFEESGYILQTGEEGTKAQNIERYYFASNSDYKNKYNEKIIFEDTEGEKVKSNLDNFIHYSNGSISSFTNGVLLNLDEIENNPIMYYNINAGSILKKQGDTYTIKNLDKELKFNNILWKISAKKYIVIGNNINIVFDDGTTKNINGYIEIEYSDNEIVKIYNQETTYQTISSKVYIEMPEKIIINLDNKIVSKEQDNKMSLENMIIDSNDNVTIVDLEEDKEENKDETTEKTEENDSDNQQSSTGGTTNNGEGIQNSGNGGNTNSSTITNNNSNTIINNGGTISSGNDVDNEDIIEIPEQPKYKVEKFEVNAIGIEATINIEDENNLLVDDTKVKIIKNTTGKTVYEKVETLGNYSIDISLATLEPNTEYTLVAESSYKIDDMVYTKDFLSKIFRTSSVGIDIEKDIFTDTTMQYVVEISKNTDIKSLDVVLQDMQGNEISTKTVVNDVKQETEDKKELIEFTGLKSNTKYKVSIINVVYKTQVITNGFELCKEYTTLKERPKISGTEFEINKRDANFKLRIKNIEDKDGAITNYRFEIFDTRMASESEKEIEFSKMEPVYTITTKEKEITVPIDDTKIFRKVGYAFRVVAEGNDNEKICEYESEYSNVFKMDGDEFPTVRFEEENITYERIEGKIIVEDKGETIHLTDDTIFTVTYTDSVGTIKSFTSQGSYVIPVSINNLRANETYQFAVYTTVDLNDGNEPIDKCYIGGALVKTGLPQNMVATYQDSSTDLKSSFKLEFRLQNENENQGTLEPETLTGMTFSIYAGQAVDGQVPIGNPIRTIKLVDTNTEPYESELKAEYYDKTIEITPKFFNAENSDFKDTWYTITVTNAYDYTDYKNALPILNNVYSIKTNGTMPDLPTDTDNALIVTALRNRDEETPREDLDAATIVGYNVKAIYDNIDLYAKKIIYKAYDSNSKQLIKTIEKEIGEDGVIPTVKFDVLDGTPNDVNDIDKLRRGNSYYFTYEILLDLNRDGIGETKYPYNEDGKEVILRSKEQTPAKQEPTFIMYPATSGSDTITFKYKCVDVDNAIYNNKFQAKIGNYVLDQKEINKTGLENFEEVTFEYLTKGTLTINVLQNTVKSKPQEERELIKQKFEGVNNVNSIKYEVQLDTNKVLVKLIDLQGTANNIVAIKVKLSAIDGSASVEKEILKLPENNIVGINFNDLGELIKKEIKVETFVYYDSGVTGYELESDHYVAYKKAKTEGEEEYYTINANDKFVETTSLRNNLFTSVRTNQNLQLINPINQKSLSVDLEYSENGFKYQGNVILQRRIDLEQISCVGDNIIRFDSIIPGISLKNQNDEFNIQTELDKVTVKAVLVIEPKTLIKDENVYVDIYETNENGTTSKLIKTETKKIDDFLNPVTITDLNPKTYYYMKFRTIIISDDGQEIERDLYDIDYQVLGKLYYFSTLADVGIENIEVEYQPVKYSEKYIDIKYTIKRVTGYDRIEYNVYHYNEETNAYELYKTAEPDKIIQFNMEKKIPINPGENFEFGDKYKIEIIPIAEYETLDKPSQIQTIELGKKEKEFTFEKLQTPIIAIRGTRTENDEISYRITIYDDDRIIENDKYTVKILDDKLNDITPEEIKKEYDVDIANNQILLSNVDTSKSYTLLVITKLDYNNSKNDLKDYTKQYVMPELNEYGISIGEVTPSQNTTNLNKVDLIFNNSYKLPEVEQIKYAIYNTNGYAQSGEEQFIPKQYELNETDVYYLYTLGTELNTYGKYIIEIQFIKENKIIDRMTLEYVYKD